MELDYNGPINHPFIQFKESDLNKPVFKLFEEVAQLYPQRLAIRDKFQSFTYNQAYQRCLHLAAQIQQSHQEKEPIGIALPNSVFFPIAMLAALANGCPYVPLDIDMPASRNQLIIRLSGLKTIVSSTEFLDHFQDVVVINIDQLDLESSMGFVSSATPNDHAYIIYTSGSMGIPKGVYQNQRNLLHDVMQYTNSIHLSKEDRLSLLYSPSVNGAIRDIYGALLSGASLHIMRLKNRGLLDLSEFIREDKITVYHSIPNIFRTFLKLNKHELDMSSVRLVYLAGDRIYNSDVLLFKQYFPNDSLLYVGIGATEIATIYRQWFISATTIIDQELVPLGFSVPDRFMQIVDEQGKITPDGEIGEIKVASDFISLGYWNDQPQTDLVFKTGDLRSYLTGDLGKINADGMLEFIGRKDHQVKINGYRVELSEIEGCLMSYHGLDGCAVLVHHMEFVTMLVAFFVSQNPIDVMLLRDWLRVKLPPYMIPKHLIQVTEIPQLPNYKTNQDKLKVLLHDYLGTSELPSNTQPNEKNDMTLIRKIRDIWSIYLDYKSFDQNMSWKEAGGDSMSVVHLIIQLEVLFHVRFPNEWIYIGLKPSDIIDFLGKNPLNLTMRPKLYYFPPTYGINERARSFLNDLGEYFNLTIVAYPQCKDVQKKNLKLENYWRFIMNQIPDFNKKSIGYLGNCHGASILNSFIVQNKLKDYAFIGILDDVSHLRRPVELSLLHRFVKNVSIDYLKPSKYLRFVYVHSSISRRFVRLLVKWFYFLFSKSLLEKILIYETQFSNRDNKLKEFLFSTEETIYSHIRQITKLEGSEMTIIPLQGPHNQLYGAENKRDIINFIKKFYFQ
ncbi:MAG: non-ribosomal peptide synthetase [Prolixibacteraceae bacterium]